MLQTGVKLVTLIFLSPDEGSQGSLSFQGALLHPPASPPFSV